MKKNREVITRAFFNLMEKWQLKRDEEAQLLGWNYKEKRTRIEAMRNGKAIDQDRDKLERMIDLINIHKSLRILFPHDRQAVYDWVKIKRDRFGNHSALELMFENGKEGIRAIRHYLDYERSH
ncbi:MAG: DUF2384 domain-containing protein [Deltaproteobacteria bacterium]|nr:DUF2384 domain-containing protein [Deltaproteobacteria bacterium]